MICWWLTKGGQALWCKAVGHCNFLTSGFAQPPTMETLSLHCVTVGSACHTEPSGRLTMGVWRGAQCRSEHKFKELE